MILPIIPVDGVLDPLQVPFLGHRIFPHKIDSRHSDLLFFILFAEQLGITERQILQKLKTILSDIGSLRHMMAEGIASYRGDLQSADRQKANGKNEHADQKFQEGVSPICCESPIQRGSSLWRNIEQSAVRPLCCFSE